MKLQRGEKKKKVRWGRQQLRSESGAREYRGRTKTQKEKGKQREGIANIFVKSFRQKNEYMSKVLNNK